MHDKRVSLYCRIIFTDPALGQYTGTGIAAYRLTGMVRDMNNYVMEEVLVRMALWWIDPIGRLAGDVTGAREVIWADRGSAGAVLSLRPDLIRLMCARAPLRLRSVGPMHELLLQMWWWAVNIIMHTFLLHEKNLTALNYYTPFTRSSKHRANVKQMYSK